MDHAGKQRRKAFQEFGREGLDSYTCGKQIRRKTMGSRKLFVCPNCQ